MQSTCYSCRILINLEFSQQIFKKYSSIHKQKFCPLEAELFHVEWGTDVQTIMTKSIGAFGKFAKGHKTSIQNQIYMKNTIMPNVLCFQWTCYLKSSIF